MNEEHTNKKEKEGTQIVKLFGVNIGEHSNNGGDDTTSHRVNSWSIDEHNSFLEGLEKLGKGKWKDISANFVPSRTPTQIASHAQKYFNRQSDDRTKQRRTSIFDIHSPHRNQGSNEAYANSSGASSAAVVSKNVNEFIEQPSTPSNVAGTISVRPPLSQVNGPTIYHEASLSNSGRKRYPTHILVPRWIAEDNNQSRGGVVEFMAPQFAVPTTTNDELNHKTDNFLGETDCEKVLGETDPNNDKLFCETVVCEPECEKVLCKTCRKPLSCVTCSKPESHETGHETNPN